MPAPISEIDSALSYMSISKLFAFESVPKAADNVSPPMPAPLPFRDYQKIFTSSSDSINIHYGDAKSLAMWVLCVVSHLYGQLLVKVFSAYQPPSLSSF